MDQSKIDLFISTTGKMLPNENIMTVRSALEKVDDSRFGILQSLDYKNPTTMFIVSFFLGGLGVDRFMLGQTGLGILKLITFGGFFIWALIDLFTIMGRVKKMNYNLFVQHAN